MEEKAIELLEQLAVQLGTTAEYLWGVLVRQAYVNAIISIIIEIVFFIFIATYIKLLIKYIHKSDSDDYGIPLFIGGFISIIMFGFMIGGILDIVTGFVNPEYWALKEILRLI